MKKQIQEVHNMVCNHAVDLIERNTTYARLHTLPEKRLRTCQAWVSTYSFSDKETGVYYTVHFLRSYNTYVCLGVYNFETDTMTFCDILRRVYGYTATSAQHISKFKQDYAIGSPYWKDSRNQYYTWKAV